MKEGARIPALRRNYRLGVTSLDVLDSLAAIGPCSPQRLGSDVGVRAEVARRHLAKLRQMGLAVIVERTIAGNQWRCTRRGRAELDRQLKLGAVPGVTPGVPQITPSAVRVLVALRAAGGEAHATEIEQRTGIAPHYGLSLCTRLGLVERLPGQPSRWTLTTS